MEPWFKASEVQMHGWTLRTERQRQSRKQSRASVGAAGMKSILATGEPRADQRSQQLRSEHKRKFGLHFEKSQQSQDKLADVRRIAHYTEPVSDRL